MADSRDIVDGPIVRRDNATGWWIAALAAIFAVVGVIILLNGRPSTGEIAVAQREAVTRISADRAVTVAQNAADKATRSAAHAAQGATDATEAAANTAAAQTIQVAQSADSAATAESAPPPH